MNIPENLPEFWVPMENDDYVPLEAFLEDENGVPQPYTTFEVAIFEPGESRPLAAWIANPGPKTPQIEGRYPVFIRAAGTPKPAVCVGTLVVF